MQACPWKAARGVCTSRPSALSSITVLRCPKSKSSLQQEIRCHRRACLLSRRDEDSVSVNTGPTSLSSCA